MKTRWTFTLRVGNGRDLFLVCLGARAFRETIITLPLACFWLAASGGAAAASSTVIAWGSNGDGQTNVPPGLTNATAVAAGYYHTLAVRIDGTVIGWGDNLYGQLSIPTGLSNVVGVIGGKSHSLALRSDGTVVAWGGPYVVTNIPSGTTNVAAIASGEWHSLALMSNGTVVAWGAGKINSGVSPNFGQSIVPADLTNVVAVAAGRFHSLALRKDGTVVSWGYNSNGQTNVPPELTNVVAIAGGWEHSLALRSDGAVVAWGYNNLGQTNVPAALSNALAIASGSSHNLALRNDGTVIAWGNNGSHQADVPVGLSSVAAVAAGLIHSVALVEDGPPVVIVQPLSQVVYQGETATIGANARGARPLSYQWRLNASDLPGATNAFFAVANAQPADAGNYSLVVTNLYGIAISSNSSLIVVTSPPVLLLEPTNQVAIISSNVFFTAAAAGPTPFGYQWQFEGLDIAGATSALLLLTNLQLSRQGNYRVVTTNLYGTTSSSNAFLDVVDLADALNATNLVWTTTGSPLWYPQTATNHDGVAAASSGPVAGYPGTALETTVTGPGTLTYWWQACGSPGGGWLVLAVDGTNEAYLQPGTPAFSGWKPATVYLAGGSHSLTWSCWTLVYAATGYVDQVTFVPGTTPALIVTAPTNRIVPAGTNSTFSVGGGGTPPLTYQWQFNGMDLPGKTGSSLNLSNVQTADAGTYRVIVTNDYGVTNADASLLVTSAAPVVLVQPANQKAVRNGTGFFTVTARGSDPLFYQWRRNGADIAGATGPQLVWTGAASNDLGDYSVVVSNAYGSVLSSNATLTLVSSLLVVWGDNSGGELSAPAYLSNVTVFASSADSCYNAAVNGDGAVVQWGCWRPAFSPAPTGVVALATGFDHMLALQANGLVASAGSVAGPSNLTEVTGISAGYRFSLALRRDGTVTSWGSGIIGSAPTNVPTELTNAIAVACGEAHGLAATGNGRVFAWGANGWGQTNAPAGLSNVTSVAAGRSHSLALRHDGSVVAWGWNLSGQADVPAGLSNVVAVAGGFRHSMALKDDGSVLVWGNNFFGQSNLPAVVTNVISIASGSDHCLALLGDGSPALVRSLLGRTAAAGDSITLNASAVGAAPLSYQWQLNGTNIAGATNALLTLANLPVTGAGDYRCLVSNALGSVTTSNATLTVTRLPLRFDTSPGSLTLASGGLHLRLLNLAGAGTVLIEASSDLVDWTPILLNPAMVGSLDFVDWAATNHLQRFYRASEGGEAPVGPLRFDNSGMAAGGFSLQLSGLTGHGAILLFASTNLVDWEPVLTNPPMVGSLQFLDLTATNLPVRYYRAEEQ